MHNALPQDRRELRRAIAVELDTAADDDARPRPRVHPREQSFLTVRNTDEIDCR